MISFSSLPECSGTIIVTPIAIAIISTGMQRNDSANDPVCYCSAMVTKGNSTGPAAGAANPSAVMLLMRRHPPLISTDASHAMPCRISNCARARLAVFPRGPVGIQSARTGPRVRPDAGEQGLIA
jgi:hypothetical protein